MNSRKKELSDAMLELQGNIRLKLYNQLLRVSYVFSEDKIKEIRKRIEINDFEGADKLLNEKPEKKAVAKKE